MPLIDVTALFVVETASSILDTCLQLAEAVGLPVTSWRVGDPTKTGYTHLANTIAKLEGASAGFVKSAFLSKASGDWLKVLAAEVYGVFPDDDISSTPSVTLSNPGGGTFPLDAGDLTVKCTATGVTFHNTSGGTLTGGGTLTLTLVADVAGTDGTVAIDEIDAIVSPPLPGVVVASSTAAIGIDAPDDDTIKQLCRDTLGALSPDGPPDAYEYVARSQKLTGVTTVNRARSTSESDTSNVTVYVAGANGPVDGASVVAVQSAIDRWATPLTVNATALSAVATVVNVTATIAGDSIPPDYVARLTSALQSYFASLQIADEAGLSVELSPLYAAFHDAMKLTRVTITAPGAAVPYTEGHVPVLGVVSITT